MRRSESPAGPLAYPGDSMNLVAHIRRQREFSEKTFGPGTRTGAVLEHTRKELDEVKANPCDLSEWVDVILLTLDGAWRMGFSPEQIAWAIVDKQLINESRQWPDWRTTPEGKPIEHIKTENINTGERE